MAFFWPFMIGAATGWVLHWQINRRWQRQEAAPLKPPSAPSHQAPSAPTLPSSDANRAPQPSAPADGSLDPLAAEATVEDRSAVMVLDRLESIAGITPAVARRLNQAGILTYADLAEQTPERLRALVAPAGLEAPPVQKWMILARDLAYEVTRPQR